MPEAKFVKTPTKVNLYRFWVVGNRNFPLDMLRYDTCAPVTGIDRLDMRREDCCGDSAMYPEQDWTKLRMVELCGTKEPTVGRWESFSWFVYGSSFEAREACRKFNEKNPE